MTIEDVIAARGIAEIVHFTTEKGRLGTLDAQALKSSKRLREDQRLSFIFTQNTRIRKDVNWLDYVSLSITRPNGHLLRISSQSWHPTLHWCILAFDPSILTHDGVWFATTNNIYTGVRRAQGPEGLEALFATRVHQYENRYCTRTDDTRANWTTDSQGEVLYPGEIDSRFLLRIYVKNDEDHDSAAAQLEAVGHPTVPIFIAPDRFR